MLHYGSISFDNPV